MSNDSGSGEALSTILDRLLEPVDDLLEILRARADRDEAAARVEDTALPSRRGENVSATIAIPRSLARRGGRTRVRITSLVTCSECGGSGVSPTADGECRHCGGSGRTPSARMLAVKFPPGVQAGDELRVAGEGNVSPTGGPPGDLSLAVMLVSKGRFGRFRS